MTDDIEFEDPIEEVYAVRRKISSRYGNNIRKIVIHRGLPFEVKLSPSPLVNCATLTDAELDAEIQRGLDDVAAGRTRPFHDFADELKTE